MNRAVPVSNKQLSIGGNQIVIFQLKPQVIQFNDLILPKVADNIRHCKATTIGPYEAGGNCRIMEFTILLTNAVVSSGLE